ncbi:hypothetical protein [Anaerosinus sp.]
MEKCKYYKNHRTAATLMIDDLSFTAIFEKNMLFPYNDWGYGLKEEDSLYSYFERSLLCKYPEIKGTFFIPLHRHEFQNINSGYDVRFNENEGNIKKFIQNISKNFEVAFHGIKHGRYLDISQCHSKDNWQQEFSYLTRKDIEMIKAEIKLFEEKYDIRLFGGKYPGYAKNDESKDIVEKLGFKWWASDSNMINEIVRGKNNYNYFGDECDILDMPSNLSGDSFKFYLTKNNNFLLGSIKKVIKNIKLEKYIQYLYQNNFVISIQEHFMNLRTDGRRQTPNVFDDIVSLDKIYAILRGADIWHATCSEIAHYLDSFDHTTITKMENGNWRIEYDGIWDEMFLSVKSSSRYLKNIHTGEILHGVYKQGDWLFNDIKEGVYKEIK